MSISGRLPSSNDGGGIGSRHMRQMKMKTTEAAAVDAVVDVAEAGSRSRRGKKTRTSMI